LRSVTRAALSLVDLATAGDEIDFEVFAGSAVAVPVGVVELHETETALDEAAGEEAVAREGRLDLLDAVEFERGLDSRR